MMLGDAADSSLHQALKPGATQQSNSDRMGWGVDMDTAGAYDTAGHQLQIALPKRGGLSLPPH